MKVHTSNKKISPTEDVAKLKELYKKSRRLGLMKRIIRVPEKNQRTTRIAIA